MKKQMLHDHFLFSPTGTIRSNTEYVPLFGPEANIQNSPSYITLQEIGGFFPLSGLPAAS